MVKIRIETTDGTYIHRSKATKEEVIKNIDHSLENNHEFARIGNPTAYYRIGIIKRIELEEE